MISISSKMCGRAVLCGISCLLLTPFEAGAARGSEKVLYAFAGGADGSVPQASLTLGNDGTLYGTTAGGGSGAECRNGCGTVFKLTPQGSETVLYAFSGGSDGSMPWGNLVLDGSGNLYGTTQLGGLGLGTVFKLASDGTETVLHTFQGAPDGSSPMGNLVADGSGNLYGTTYYGGNTGGSECGDSGCGTVFKVTPAGTETVLYAFQGGSDGLAPWGGVILDGQGNLYGTTVAGGGSGCGAGFGCGTVFKVAPDGTETVLYAFQGGNDGASPQSNPILDGSGNLYGTTTGGDGCGGECGTVYKLTPDGTETVLHRFNHGSQGYNPIGGLVEDGAGDLYGTASSGGEHGCNFAGCGVVFKLTPGGKENVLYAFKASHGKGPTAGLILDASGELYGTTPHGGHNNNGVVFELKK